MQQFGDADAWHHCVEPIGQGFRFGRGDGLHRRDVQPLVTHFDTFELAAPQALREALQPPVKFPAACCQPFIRCCGQVQLSCDRRHRRGGQQIAVESAVIGRPLHPDVPGAKLVAQRSQHRRFIETPVWLPSFGDQPPPFLSERHWRIRRDLALAGLVEISQQCDRGENRVVGLGRLELQRFDQRRRELPHGLRTDRRRGPAGLPAVSAARLAISRRARSNFAQPTASSTTANASRSFSWAWPERFDRAHRKAASGGRRLSSSRHRPVPWCSCRARTRSPTSLSVMSSTASVSRTSRSIKSAATVSRAAGAARSARSCWWARPGPRG